MQVVKFFYWINSYFWLLIHKRRIYYFYFLDFVFKIPYWSRFVVHVLMFEMWKSLLLNEVLLVEFKLNVICHLLTLSNFQNFRKTFQVAHSAGISSFHSTGQKSHTKTPLSIRIRRIRWLVYGVAEEQFAPLSQPVKLFSEFNGLFAEMM